MKGSNKRIPLFETFCLQICTEPTNLKLPSQAFTKCLPT